MDQEMKCLKCGGEMETLEFQSMGPGFSEWENGEDEARCGICHEPATGEQLNEQWVESMKAQEREGFTQTPEQAERDFGDREVPDMSNAHFSGDRPACEEWL